MELTPDKLIPQVSAPAGVAAFLEEARNSKITLFI